MAKGDTTITSIARERPGYGGFKSAYLSLLLDNYKAGGYTADFSAFNLGTIKVVEMPPVLAGYALEYDYVNKKILVYTAPVGAVSAAPFAELADDSSALATKSIVVRVVGIGN